MYFFDIYVYIYICIYICIMVLFIRLQVFIPLRFNVIYLSVVIH